jgi:hypothetical protein
MEKAHRYAQESATIDRARRKLENREKEKVSPTANMPGMISKISKEVQTGAVIAANSPEIETLKATLSAPEDPRIAALRQKIAFGGGKGPRSL